MWIKVLTPVTIIIMVVESVSTFKDQETSSAPMWIQSAT